MLRWTVSLLFLALTAVAKPPHSYPLLGRIIREDARLDAILPPDARVEVIASGFEWAEGPVWDRASGSLLFSDIPRNTIFRWSAKNGVAAWMKP